MFDDIISFDSTSNQFEIRIDDELQAATTKSRDLDRIMADLVQYGE